MRTIQEIFDTVIRRGIYEPFTAKREMLHAGMCRALRRTWKEGGITESEYYFAMGEVERYGRELAGGKYYIPGTNFLADALKRAGLNSSAKAQREIYKDWANRPRRVAP